ncbi:MAG: glucose-6-phosphate dehydrogenase [Candidatus Woesebacteria bacterium]|jgi:glucose-6-phosphate 1-dehydrogenase
MQTTPDSTILVIVGITGDLSRRKLLPAISKIARAGELPSNFKIIGISRQKIQPKDALTQDVDSLKDFICMHKMDLSDTKDYSDLKNLLATTEQNLGGNAQKLFYLSIPPHAARPVIKSLGKAGFGKDKTVKLLLEKPFGTDEQSAIQTIQDIRKYFNEQQIYRIDHYLAKEAVQNLTVFRSGNSLFKRTWNKNYIKSIQIISSETIGIEGRSSFYEQTGALRDVVQSHLVQLAALALMDLPKDNDWSKIPKLRLRALKNLKPPQNIAQQVIRGQYKSYRHEVDNPQTTVETFASVTLFSDDKKWQGVPITLTTGKSLNQKTIEIRINYKQQNQQEANRLVLRIQPQEAIEFDIWVKQPGYGKSLKQVPFDFTYSNHFNDLPEAYEQVFVDAIRGDRNLFTTSDEVLASWRILDPIQHAWSMQNYDLIFYKNGSDPKDIAPNI